MKRLTALRQARGWSKAELARRARVAEADVGKVEFGRLVPYEPQLRRLARALGVDAREAQTLLEALEDASSDTTLDNLPISNDGPPYGEPHS